MGALTAGCTPFRMKFGVVALSLQVLFAILFAALARYDSSADPKLPNKGDKDYNSNGTSFEEASAFLESKYPGKTIASRFSSLITQV